jgi:membrane-associated protease RseP (regulator of RpoE activity)
MDLIGVVIFVLALLFSIMFHETGHFVMAKRFGMKCTRYFVGMGPTVWSTWRGETEYGIKALPIGGFVKIIGMHSLDDVDDPEDESRSFRSKPAWQRIVVLCAGSFMHFLLAFMILAGMALTLGIENDNTAQLGTVITCLAPNVTDLDNGNCGAAHQPSPASAAGLQVGDSVTSFDGTAVSNWTQLSTLIKAAKPGQKVTLTVLRDGKTLHLSTTLAQVKGRDGAYMGIAPATVFQVAGPVGALSFYGSAVAQELSGSVQAISALPSALPKLFSKKGRADTSAGQIQSMVGVAESTGQAVAADVGWRPKVEYVLLIVASLNIFIGALNLLPLLPLDGGHVALIVWERIRAWLARLRHRPDPGLVDMRKALPVMFSLFMVIVAFSVVLMIADIVNPLGGGA